MSGRSHETSTFQQHQDYFESLKEIGEENEDDEHEGVSCVYNNRVEDDRSHSYNFTMNKDST
jgi:hypothetical protein